MSRGPLDVNPTEGCEVALISTKTLHEVRDSRDGALVGLVMETDRGWMGRIRLWNKPGYLDCAYHCAETTSKEKAADDVVKFSRDNPHFVGKPDAPKETCLRVVGPGNIPVDEKQNGSGS
mgnify:CR=1 FL=1